MGRSPRPLEDDLALARRIQVTKGPDSMGSRNLVVEERGATSDNSDDELKQVERLPDHKSIEGAYPVACYRLEVA
jgi:hypothetical protein